MNIEEIMSEWSKDAEIDENNLRTESLRTSKLHSKYTNALVKENILLAKKKTDYNKLILDTYVFYTEGALKVSDVKRAPRGAVLKSEAEKYIQADAGIIKLSLELSLQQEKVDFLKSILNEVNKRSYHIKNHIDIQKFLAGVN